MAKNIQLYDKEGNKLYPYTAAKPPTEFAKIVDNVVLEAAFSTNAFANLVYSKNRGFVWETVVLGSALPKYYLASNNVAADELIKFGDICIMGDRMFIRTNTGLFEFRNNV